MDDRWQTEQFYGLYPFAVRTGERVQAPLVEDFAVDPKVSLPWSRCFDFENTVEVGVSGSSISRTARTCIS